MARGYLKVNARRTPEPEDLRALLSRAEKIEDNFAALIASKIRGGRG